MGEGLGDVVVARVERDRSHRGCRPDPAGRGRRRQRAGRGGVRGLELRGRRPGPAGPGRCRAPRRVRDRPPQDEGRRLQRDAVLGPRAPALRRPRRDPAPQRGRRRPSGPSADRGPGDRTRRGLRHRRRGQPPRCLVHGRGGPGPGRPAGPALRHPRRRRSGAGCTGEPGADPGRDARRPPVDTLASVRVDDPDLCPRLHRPGDHRGRAGAVARLAGPTTDPGRDAAHQQRGRRVQLRDARARPAHPPLRPRPAGRSRPGRPAGAAGGDAWSPSTGWSARSGRPVPGSATPARTASSATPRDRRWASAG